MAQNVQYFAGPASLPFSEAVRVGDMLYLSGQIGIRTVRSAEGAAPKIELPRSAMGANGLALGARVEIECVATVG